MKKSIRLIRAETQAIREALQDVAYGRPSMTTGPIELDNHSQLVEGYHRLIHYILSGIREVETVLVDRSAPMIRLKFTFQDTPLMGLESVIKDLDDDVLDSLAIKYPHAAPTIISIKSGEIG